MPSLRPLFLALFSALVLAAQSAAPNPPAPLQPGEGLAVATAGGEVFCYGDSAREYPLGGLAEFPWLRLEGQEWGAMALGYKCTGSQDGHPCDLPKGHGKVDLAKAFQGNCSLAFLAWGRAMVPMWVRDLGEGAARFQLEEAFSPFLGNRMPPGDGLPPITPAWVGEGDFLRASTEGMLRWLIDPAQDTTLRLAKRLVLSFRDFTIKGKDWWVVTATAPTAADPAACTSWAVGSNGQIVGVLHLPQGTGRAASLARFQAIFKVPVEK
jgi:hypothetical protein